MSTAAAPGSDGGLAFLADVGAILRFHIVLIAMAATLVFGWLLTGAVPVGLAAVVGVDWLLINLLNRITDIDEDRANGIRGTDLVARHRGVFTGLFGAVLVGSFAATWLAYPAIGWLRAIVQVIGVGYSVAVVPTPSGPKRFKDLYFLKNFMSSVLFVLTVFLYPVATAGWGVVLPGGLAAAVLLVVFFVLFELTYEILYDMRDLEGDRLAGVPTYPVVHGLDRARQIVDGLLLASALVLVGGLGAGLLGLREGLFLAAPAVQLAFYRPRFRRGLTSRDCIWLTHVGTGLLLFFLAGTAVWSWAGLPENVFLR